MSTTAKLFGTSATAAVGSGVSAPSVASVRAGASSSVEVKGTKFGKGVSKVDTDKLFRTVVPPPAPAPETSIGTRRRRPTSVAIGGELPTATGSAPTDGSNPPPTKRHRSHMTDEQDPAELRRTAFVSNLPNVADKADVAKHFRDCGAIESVRLRCLKLAPEKGDKARGRGVRVLRGELVQDDKASAAAYIVFQRPASVDLALTMSGSVFKGRHLTVAREDAEAKAFLPKFSVFLGNLDRNIADEEVWNYFLERGIKDVDRVRVIRDRETGEARGIGYVGFRSSASVQRAIDVREQDLCGRPLRICHVQKPKTANLQVAAATRREKRRFEHQQAVLQHGPSTTTTAAPTTAVARRLTKKDKLKAKEQAKADGAEVPAGANKTSGRREEAQAVGMETTPAWMGVATNPRKKLPLELRKLTQNSADRKKAITEKRKANQERVREQRTKRAGKGGSGAGKDDS